jgi:CheY-like chemotaxis protein
MKILVVDDTEANRKLLTWILEDDGHSVVEAKDGRQAVELFKQSDIDLVLMDVMMPVMDGFEATQAIKEYLGDRHVPIIFLTALSDDASLAKCLSIGGDDFLSKPINEQVLQAKIKAHSRIKDLNEQLNRQNRQLTRLNHLTQREHEIAKTVFDNALAASRLDCGNIRQYISPAATFNGDLLLVSVSPSGGLYALLADFTGHGLPAAIGAIPMSQTFFDATQQGASVSSIARALNKVLTKFLPDYMFAAAAIAELSADGKRLSLWMGGMPEAILTDNQGRLKERIQSTHMPLGILQDDEFERNPHIVEVDQGDRVYLYTDGIPEAQDGNGELYGETRLIRHFTGTTPDPFTTLIDDVTTFSSGKGQIDDITLLELTCKPVQVSAGDAEPGTPPALVPWQLNVRLTPQQLRSGSPVPQLIDMLGTSPHVERHKDYLHTILAELFANALEHGVLGLSSELKRSEEGYLDYYQQREQRLRSLDDGYVNIALALSCDHTRTCIKMRVDDSGQGFDFSQHRPPGDDDAFGRGISLLQTLCARVEYSNGGTRVNVEYLLD